MKKIKINNLNIGKEYEPVIIAEMSGNHNQSLEKALQIVQEAQSNGAQMLKLQTYTADTMTLNVKGGDFYIDDKKSLWYGKNLYDLYNVAYTPWEWHKEIFDYCKELGIVGFSTPFDSSAVEFLEKLDVPLYKIASFENTHLSLIELVASTEKPVIVSTGMATLSEIDQIVNTLHKSNCKNFILLKCTSSYPAKISDSNIATIPYLEKLFDCQVGLSDHTMGIGAAIAAVSHGATIIEKHFTLSRKDEGVDSAFSVEPLELKSLVQESKNAWSSLGKVSHGPLKNEIASLGFRRSIYVSQPMKSGEIFSDENIRIVRPGYGLSPSFYKLIIGRKANQDLPVGTALKLEFVS